MAMTTSAVETAVTVNGVMVIVSPAGARIRPAPAPSAVRVAGCSRLPTTPSKAIAIATAPTPQDVRQSGRKRLPKVGVGSPASAASKPTVHEACAAAPRRNEAIAVAAVASVCTRGSSSCARTNARTPITRTTGARFVSAPGTQLRGLSSDITSPMMKTKTMLMLSGIARIPHHKARFIRGCFLGCSG